MSIAWFPGHMASARKKAAETMGRIDVVVELLDARLPGASANPLIERLRRDKQRPCLKILNKADLADPDATAAWLRHYGNEKLVRAVALSCKRPGDVAKVPRLAAALAPHRDSALKIAGNIWTSTAASWAHIDPSTECHPENLPPPPPKT